MMKQPRLMIAGILMIGGAVTFTVGDRVSSGILVGAGSILLLVGAILMTNSNNRAIALNTCREALRNRILYIILVFTILLIGFAVVLGSISIGQNDRVIKHVGLSAINLFGIFLAMFVGVNLVYEEMDRRTIYTIIAHGVPRQDFIIGKFLGLLLTITINFAIMALILSLVILMVPEASWNVAILYAVFMSLFEMMIVIAFAILFSSFSTPIISAVLTLGVYIIGHLSDDLLDYIKIQGHQAYAFHPEKVVPLLKSLYYGLPHLEEFNAKSQVIDPAGLQWTWSPIGYGILYTTIVLSLACWIFSKKDFR